MVIESESPSLEQLEDDLRHLTLTAPEKSRESTQQPHSVFTLPPELLGDIFAMVCHANFHEFHSDSDEDRHNKTTAFTLGKICRDWRNIVWSTPAIWSYVFLCISLSRYDAQVKLLKGWLERSGAYALSLNFVFQNEDDWSHKEPPMELISLLSSSSYRWRVISMVLPEAWYQALNEIQYNLPMLMEVSTQPLSSDCALTPSKRKRLTLFKYAPVLNDIHLNGYYLSDVHIPWIQLRHLTLQHVYLDECFFALSRSPNLVTFRIYTLLENDVDRVVNESDIHLPLLEEILFFRVFWDDTQRLFSHLTTPLLQTLEFSKPQDALNFPKILPLLSQSGSLLLQLKLEAFTLTCDEGELLELLCNVPTLRKVEISTKANSVPVSNLFIDLLKLQPSTSTAPNVEDLSPCTTPYFLPDLETFIFSGPFDAPPGFTELLLGVLHLRRNLTPRMLDHGPFPFSWLDIKTDTACTFSLPGETKDKLQELVDDGLHLSVVFNGHSWL